MPQVPDTADQPLLRQFPRRPRETGAEPRFLSPALALAFLQTEQPTLTPDLPRDISCFRLLLPKGTLFSEEGPEIRSVVVAEVRAMEGWLLVGPVAAPMEWVEPVLLG
jgi:hypothetical protein